MAQYTTTVGNIVESYNGLTEPSDYPITPLIDNAIPRIFENYPLFDEAYRQTLNRKILRHFYFREIGLETPGLWKEFLNRKMFEIMPYYNQLYESAALKFNPLWDTDYTTNRNTKGQTDSKMQRGSTTDRKEGAEENYKGHDDTTQNQTGEEHGTDSGTEHSTKHTSSEGHEDTSGREVTTYGETTDTASQSQGTTTAAKDSTGKEVTKWGEERSGTNSETSTGTGTVEETSGKDINGTTKDTYKETNSSNSSTTEEENANASTTTDGTTTGTLTGKETAAKTGNDIHATQGHIGETGTKSATGDVTTSGTSDRENRFSDTPQGSITGLRQDNYMTNATLEGIDTTGTEHTTGSENTTHERDEDTQVTDTYNSTLTTDKTENTNGTNKETADTESHKETEGTENTSGKKDYTLDKTQTSGETGKVERTSSDSKKMDGTTSETAAGDKTVDTTGHQSEEGTTKESKTGNTKMTGNKETDTTKATDTAGKTGEETTRETTGKFDNTSKNDIIGSKDSTYNKTNNFQMGQTDKGTEDRQGASVEDYWQHVAGKVGSGSYSKLITEWRDTFLNIDMMIIRDLSGLFMNIW